LKKSKEREMTTRKKTTRGKGDSKKLKLKKETIRDLDVKSKARDVKGGVAHATQPQGGC
jgi:hypothetical protein